MKSIAYHIANGLYIVLKFLLFVYLVPSMPLMLLIQITKLARASLSETRAKRGVSGEKGWPY